ncbi:hypothetical protein HPB49_004752 [Dermacentor silvarum]|uniref:Uncharacterized protein n=1 Tax=Dermacentor silvarum TaxID=543639 RepID=A0ACB8C7D3_DERSI|nr:uncharacterized protein LOC119462269 [Dermacentor silvarum]KAH7936798.1 hypothetical protein HPB49_004752 [Dermacentor silvarum]
MAAKYSSERVYCADYLSKHKKLIAKKRNFRRVTDVDVNALEQLLTSETSVTVKENDYLCYPCFRYFCNEISSRNTQLSDDIFMPPEAEINIVNQIIATTCVSPLKRPGAVRSRDRPTYIKRKQSEVQKAVAENVRNKIRRAYNQCDASGNSAERKCSFCEQWTESFRQAYAASTTPQERYQLLTLLPSTLAKHEIKKLIPEASMYEINKSRKLKENHGVWYRPDPFTRHKVSPECVSAAREYYTKDELECSRQSPNRKDVLSVTIDGEKVLVTKRFMTRSIREAFRIYKDDHPDSGIGLSKFYTLRPRWVKCYPQHDVCVCVICANYKLCLAALENITGHRINSDDLHSAFICIPSSAQCLLRECNQCLKGGSLTVEELNIPEEEEIQLATWEAGDLVKKVLDADTFLNHLRVLVAKWIVHNHIRKTQGKAIYEEKQCTQRGSIVFHFDFAENWTVVLPDEVQAYHWKKQQVSVFTCVVTTKKSTESFAIVSDDLNHDSAHACLALKKATEWVDDNLPVYSKVTYVSDGAASHFKNRYRLYEFGKSDCPNTQWIFSATGHGKNACDGVGGLVKHQAMLNNLRTSPESAIRAARDFVTILTEKLKGVHLIHLEEKEVVAFRDLKKDEWMKVPAFHGIQSWHAWQLSRSTEASPELYVARIAGSAWKKLCVQE